MFKENKNAREINSIVKKEVENISNPIIKNALTKILRYPMAHERFWEYGSKNQKFICWTFAADEDSGLNLVYSDYGFGPDTPWGLVMETLQNFGMDSSWFSHLESCFLNSTTAAKLKIWRVLEQIGSSVNKTIYSDISLEEAFIKRDKLALKTPFLNYVVSHI